MTPDVLTALGAWPYHQESFVKIVFSDGFTLPLWTGTGPYPLSGTTYQPTSAGSAALGTISPIADTSDMSSQPMLLTMSGIGTSILSELRSYSHQGAAVTVIEAQFDQNDTIIPDAYNLFVGRIDTMQLAAGKTLTITAACTGLLQLAFRGPDGRRRTQADTESIFVGSGDIGLCFASRLKDSIPWGVSNKIEARQGLTNI